jgi:hypothetical protein
LESEQEKQSGAVSACTNNARVDVKKALKGLQWTQKDLSKYLDISQPKISLGLNNRAADTEPETILTQMISFLEAEEMNIRTKTSTGSNAEHSTGRKDGGSPNNSKYESQLTTPQLPNTGTTTPPPPTAIKTPNAPLADTSTTSLNNEHGLQGGYAHGRDGKSIDQVNMHQDMDAMP